MAKSLSPRVGTYWLLAATPLMMLVAHYVSVIPHEFAHSIVAWILGINDRPGNIDWGGTSLLNVLFLANIDENVDYTAAFEAGKMWQAAVTAFVGPGLVNVGLFLVSRFVLGRPWLRGRPVIANFVFWFLLMNLGNVYAYVPMRVFANHGDVFNFSKGTGIDPWVIFIVGSYLVLWAIVDLYRTALPLGAQLSGFVTRTARAVLLIAATLMLFGYYANPSSLMGSDLRLQALAAVSVMAVPPIILLLWRHIVTRPSDGIPEQDGPRKVRRADDAWALRAGPG